MIYNAQYEMCALVFLLVLVVYFFVKEKLYSAQSVIFGIFMVCTVLDLVLDIWAAFLLNNAAVVPLWLNYAVNTAFLSMQAILPAMFMIYAMALTGYLKRDKIPTIVLLMIPTLVCLGLIISTPFTGIFFYFTEALQYQHAPMFLLIYIACVMHFVVGVGVVFRFRKRITKLQRYTVFSFVTLLLTAITVQYLHPELLLTGVAATLALMMMFLTLQNPGELLDQSTGLYNRSAFFQRVSDYISRRVERQLVVLELEGTRRALYLLGLEGGEALFGQITDFLYTQGREVFRIQDDKFAILQKRRCTAEQNALCAQAVCERFARPWNVLGTELLLPARVCHLPLTEFAANASELAAVMDQALEQAALLLDGQALAVDEKVVRSIRRKRRVKQSLERAVLHPTPAEQAGQELQVYFQPVYALQDGAPEKRPCALETLVRLWDADLGVVPPGEFIDVAEKNGLIHLLGETVLKKACAFAQQNRLWERGVHTLAVNLSTVQCLRENLADRLCSILSHYDIPREMIVFEITESTAITSEQQVANIMRVLADFGVRFAMDDFGAGTWGSKSILRFPFHHIKLDKSLLWEAEHNPQGRMLVQSIAHTLREMGKQIVVEGVETKEQLALAAECGADFVQGYYCSCPLPADILIAQAFESEAAYVSRADECSTGACDCPTT